MNKFNLCAHLRLRCRCCKSYNINMQFSRIILFMMGLDLCQFIPGAFGEFAQELNVLHVGDKIEVEVGIVAACKNTTRSRKKTEKIMKKFSVCLLKRGNTLIENDFLSHFTTICKSQKRHLKCWDKMKRQVLKKCGRGNEQHLPNLYSFTLLSFCGSDRGAKKIQELTEVAHDEFRPDGGSSCTDPDVIFQNYRFHCQRFLGRMASFDNCIRHRAISNCVSRVVSLICPGVDQIPGVFRAYDQMYRNVSTLLNCGM